MATVREGLIRAVRRGRGGFWQLLPRLLPIAGRASGLPKIKKSGRSRSRINDTAAAVTARDGELVDADQQIQQKQDRGHTIPRKLHRRRFAIAINIIINNIVTIVTGATTAGSACQFLFSTTGSACQFLFLDGGERK